MIICTILVLIYTFCLLKENGFKFIDKPSTTLKHCFYTVLSIALVVMSIIFTPGYTACNMQSEVCETLRDNIAGFMLVIDFALLVIILISSVMWGIGVIEKKFKKWKIEADDEYLNNN